MLKVLPSYLRGWFFAAVGGLIAASTLSGCPGTLDPELLKMATGAGGSNGNGGDNPAGGSGGTGGTGGSISACTGGNDGATIVTGTCAVTGCHDSTSASFSGGLDLTVNSTISSRLVGVTAGGNVPNNSMCVGQTEPYLTPGSNPATGLLIDKVEANPPCGSRMPFGGFALATTQQNCLIQWATTLTAP